MSVEKVIFHYFMSKYLIILAGSPRGGEQTYNSLYKNVLNNLSADLAVCTTEDYYDEKISLFDKAKYKWIVRDYDNFFNYYEENYQGSWRQYFEKGKGTGLYESGSIHFVFKDIILKNYLDTLKKYDFIIYSRFDQYYLSSHIYGIEDKILIPAGEDYFGVCDRHAVVPKKLIDKFLNICEFINSEESLSYETTYLNCETSFMHHLDSEGLTDYIERYPRTQFTSALAKDKTNWRVPQYKLYFYKSIWIKYPDEFIDSCKNLLSGQHKINFIFSNFIIALNFYYLIVRRLFGKIKKNLLF